MPRRTKEASLGMPKICIIKKHTFSIKSSQLEGSFSTPGYNMSNYTGDFYSRADRTDYHHFHHYQLDIMNITSNVHSGNLVVTVETLDEQENWWYSRQQKRLELKDEELNRIFMFFLF